MSQPEFDAKAFLKTLPNSAGVYQMYNEKNEIIYVGKAKNLKNRVSNYFSGKPTNSKTQALVNRIASIQVTVTKTESEALLLEHNLIKQESPRYNILLKDDKSYPYILVTDEPWPRIGLHRGPKRTKGQYFGPYPNAYAAREALVLLQRVFKVRQCENSFFRNRSRPCLQYQIERCKGPCVDLVESDEYQKDIDRTLRFLKGENEELVQSLMEDMEAASVNLEFEKAEGYRDSLVQLRKVQSGQVIEKGSANLDVIAAATDGSSACVHMLFIRQGRIIGSRSFYPKDELAASPAEVVADFVPHYYLAGQERVPPSEIVISESINEAQVVEQTISELLSRRVKINVPKKGRRLEWLDVAKRTAEQNLSGRLASRQGHKQRLTQLGDALDIGINPKRLECYDISHHAGADTVASCVVFDESGPVKEDYRKFNIKDITPGDDYAAMEQVLRRRFTRLKNGEGSMPDILIIDGGKGQMTQAKKVLKDLGIADLVLLGVAKGAARKSGWEKLFIGEDSTEIVLDAHSPAFHLIQNIRDEAHRFAVAGHTARKNKKLTSSPLDQIQGIGAKRKKALLTHFGGLQGISSAGVGDLAKVEGINRNLAEDIYSHFHD